MGQAWNKTSQQDVKYSEVEDNKNILESKRVTLFYQMAHMRNKNSDYYSAYEPRLFPDQKQLITYSYNETERTIVGIMLERKDLIFLYEYRGEYIGIEFFISFSKESLSYKLIKVEELNS